MHDNIVSMPLTHFINILLTPSNNNYGTWGGKVAFLHAKTSANG